ncbi:hypothetical protein C7212DRAFT_275827 [Tuber magnatum]|uniref:BOD1/SHG1 domain-containing protein n=1 Tax=Tuber magnatum TaxID=42249 RepID=A0A317T0C8_9PEZI|nr:hypothetical protein C7212DRAFT_275827 [Tuber magnatum]
MSDSYRPSNSPLTNGHHHHDNHHHRPASTLPPPHPSLPPTPILSEEAKSTIDLLKTTYKKRGHFDSLRKDIYQSFTDTDTKLHFITALEKIAGAEIERDPSLLARDKGKAAELIEATVLRGDTYSNVEKAVEELLAARRAEIEGMLRGIMEEQGAS